MHKKGKLMKRRGLFYWHLTYNGKILARSPAHGFKQKATAKKSFARLFPDVELS